MTPGITEQIVPLNEAAAYAMQRNAAAARCRAGDAIIGYKVGCVGPAVSAQLGIAGPIRGRLFRSELHVSGSTLALDRYHNLAIEGEMAVRIGSRGRVVAAHPVIELHNYVFSGAEKTAPELIARNGLNSGVVMPFAARVKPIGRWVNAKVLSVLINGLAVDSGPLWAFRGGRQGGRRLAALKSRDGRNKA